MADITIKSVAVFLLCVFVFSNYIVPRLGHEHLSRCLGNIFSVVLSYVIATNLKEGKVQVSGKAVLVTGCDTGIGNALARYLDQRGFRVFAGCLDERGEGSSRLKRECSRKLQVIQMDVTSDQQVKDVAQFVQSAVVVSGDVLWGIVNNAGIISLGEVEWLPLDSYRKVLEVNLLGTIRVTKAFLPMVRKCKGRVVNMSSMQGRFCSPITSAYCISKYGVEAFSDCLRYELDKWGVKTIIVEPGNFAACTDAFKGDGGTNMLDNVWSQTPDHIKRDYGEDYFRSVRNLLSKSVINTSAFTLVPVLTAIEDALTDKNPPERLFSGNVRSRVVTWIFSYLPATLTDCLYRLSFSLSVDPVKWMDDDLKS